MTNIDSIIQETIDSYVNSNLITEKRKEGRKENEKKDNDNESEDDSKKDKRFRKKALKRKGGLRKDFNVEDEKKYNQNVDDQEQTSILNKLSNGFINIKKVAEKLYPDHTPEGAQSQLNKKLTGAKSDSGSTYKLKKKEVKKLRHIISSFLK